MYRSIIASAIIVMLTATAASADHRRHRHHGHHHHGHHHKPNYGAYVAGAIALGVLGAAASQYYRPRCEDVIVDYDYYGRPIYRRVCQ